MKGKLMLVEQQNNFLLVWSLPEESGCFVGGSQSEERINFKFMIFGFLSQVQKGINHDR